MLGKFHAALYMLIRQVSTDEQVVYISEGD